MTARALRLPTTRSKQIALRSMLYGIVCCVSLFTAVFAAACRFSQPFIGINSILLIFCFVLKLLAVWPELRWFDLGRRRALIAGLLLAFFGDIFVLANYVLYIYALFPLQTWAGAVWMYFSLACIILAYALLLNDRRFSLGEGRFFLAATALFSFVNTFMFLRWMAGYV